MHAQSKRRLEAAHVCRLAAAAELVNRVFKMRLRERQNLRPGGATRRAAVSWTGGKDCHLSLLQAWRNEELEVVTLVVFRPRDADFKAHPIALMHAQAAALSLPLVDVEVSSQPSYKESYAQTLAQLHRERGVQVVVTGDIDLVGHMKRNWIEECCELASARLGAPDAIRAELPLWQADRNACLSALLLEKHEVVFSCVKSPWFDASWIGRTLDSDALLELQYLARTAALDVSGEQGEYHTMVLDGPLYLEAIGLRQEDWTAELLSNQNGQPNEQQWWVLAARR
mmetsp:Transcript_13369/g.35943  ORF Transcript_13369/g.35943 Transcript_13369/m.35943 type:complete len:284 (-) Transcript_13369:948-1799(-)